MSWLTNWNYRKPITISSGSSLTDYQVLVTIDTQALIPAKMRSDCGDIRFTDSDGSTLLSYWIESGINSSSTKIWIKIPSISIGTKTIYLYYNNSGATTTSNIPNTFIREVTGVIGAWDLNGDALDSSGNGNTGTLQGFLGYTIGIHGLAIGIDASPGKYVSTANADFLNTYSAGTFEAWIYPKSLSAADIATYSTTTSVSSFLRIYIDTNGKIALSYKCGNGLTNDLHSTATITTNAWNHIVITSNGNTYYMYINGTYTAPIAGTFQCGSMDGDWFADIQQEGTHYLHIGHFFRYLTPSSSEFNGLINGIRLYSQALTSTEITDIYNNYGYTTTNYPGRELVRKYISPEPTFSTIGSEETLAANITATSLVITPSDPCISGSCTVWVDVIWTNTGGTAGSFTPSIKIDNVPVVVSPQLDIVTLGPSETMSQSQRFIITGLTTGTHNICPDPN